MSEADYLNTFLEPLRICEAYRPAFGTNGDMGLSLADFAKLYGADEFYSWIGLDSPLVYAAHRAAGGLTSIYRQVGVGAERLLREIIMDSLQLNREQVAWSYEYQKTKKQKARHTLDALVTLADLKAANSLRMSNWLETAKVVTGANRKRVSLQGAVFEIRQGYKSADSKRQNADIRFALRASQEQLLPVVAVLSSQVSETVIQRYRNNGMLVLTGIPSEDTTASTFAFFKTVVGYDLAEFFRRNSTEIKHVVHRLVQDLLTAET